MSLSLSPEVIHKDKFNKSTIVFRKNSHKVDHNNSEVVVEKNERKYSFHLVDDKGFFQDKDMKKNMIRLKEKIPIPIPTQLRKGRNDKYNKTHNKQAKQIQEMIDNTINIGPAQLFERDGARLTEGIVVKDHYANTLAGGEGLEDCKMTISSREDDEEKNIVKLQNEDNNILGLNHVVDIDENIKTKENKASVVNVKELKIYCGSGSVKTVKVINNKDDNEFEQIIESFPYKMCLICDQYFLIENLIGADCSHVFCVKCSKAFFEEKIEEGEKHIKCPLYKCLFSIKDDIISRLVTAKHLETYERKLDGASEKMIINSTPTNKDDIVISANYSPRKLVSLDAKTSKMKVYSQKHVFDITNNESFLFFNKAKEQFCTKCYEPALFGKTRKNFVKCLNCLSNLCKYCDKDYTSDHFNITGFNYCKVYFRKKTMCQPSTSNTAKDILSGIVLFFVGYFVFVLGVFKYISNFYNDGLNLSNDIQGTYYYPLYAVYLLLMLVSIAVVLPLLLFVLPYYPLMIYMYN